MEIRWHPLQSVRNASCIFSKYIMYVIIVLENPVVIRPQVKERPAFSKISTRGLFS